VKRWVGIVIDRSLWYEYFPSQSSALMVIFDIYGIIVIIVNITIRNIWLPPQLIGKKLYSRTEHWLNIPMLFTMTIAIGKLELSITRWRNAYARWKTWVACKAVSQLPLFNVHIQRQRGEGHNYASEWHTDVLEDYCEAKFAQCPSCSNPHWSARNHVA